MVADQLLESTDESTLVSVPVPAVDDSVVLLPAVAVVGTVESAMLPPRPSKRGDASGRGDLAGPARGMSSLPSRGRLRHVALLRVGGAQDHDHRRGRT